MLSSVSAPYGDYYNDIQNLTPEDVCNSITEIYSGFGKESMNPVEKCD